MKVALFSIYRFLIFFSSYFKNRFSDGEGMLLIKKDKLEKRMMKAENLKIDKSSFYQLPENSHFVN